MINLVDKSFKYGIIVGFCITTIAAIIAFIIHVIQQH